MAASGNANSSTSHAEFGRHDDGDQRGGRDQHQVEQRLERQRGAETFAAADTLECSAMATPTSTKFARK